MLKKLTKKGIKKGIHGLRHVIRWAEESLDGEISQDTDPGLAYPWLNSILVKVCREAHVRPAYCWGVLQGAHLAKAIGINRVSVIEFGVAGGNGLVSLEKVAENVEDILGIGVDVYGFDTGAGLPPPEDYRDLPNIYQEQGFRMDVEKLKAHLNKAQLVLGPVESTVPDFINSRPAPLAFISFDLDYYSSTMHAFKLFEADQTILLPRIYCYFDDIFGHTFSDYTGERLAIREFNEQHRSRKISPIYGLRYFLPEPYWQQPWSEMFYLAHIFDHHLYCAKDGLLKPSRYHVTDLKTS